MRGKTLLFLLSLSLEYGWVCERCTVEAGAGQPGPEWFPGYRPLLGIMVRRFKANGPSLLTPLHRFPSCSFLKGFSPFPFLSLISISIFYNPLFFHFSQFGYPLFCCRLRLKSSLRFLRLIRFLLYHSLSSPRYGFFLLLVRFMFWVMGCISNFNYYICVDKFYYFPGLRLRSHMVICYL